MSRKTLLCSLLGTILALGLPAPHVALAAGWTEFPGTPTATFQATTADIDPDGSTAADPVSGSNLVRQLLRTFVAMFVL
jgi:hypothetical protein